MTLVVIGTSCVRGGIHSGSYYMIARFGPVCTPQGTSLATSSSVRRRRVDDGGGRRGVHGPAPRARARARASHRVRVGGGGVVRYCREEHQGQGQAGGESRHPEARDRGVHGAVRYMDSRVCFVSVDSPWTRWMRGKLFGRSRRGVAVAICVPQARGRAEQQIHVSQEDGLHPRDHADRNMVASRRHHSSHGGGPTVARWLGVVSFYDP